MIAFCASWAKHCEFLTADWDKFSARAQNISVGLVDIGIEKELAAQHNIQSAPTIKLIYEAEIIAYRGGRSVESFETFVERQIEERTPKEPEPELEQMCRIQSDVIPLTVDNFEAKVAGKHFFLMFYAPWCRFCEELLPVWQDLADNPKYNIGKIDAIGEAPLRFKFHVAGYPTLILLTEDGERIRYRGDRTVKAFTQFLEENLYPGEFEALESADII